jgi:hypothetical protein
MKKVLYVLLFLSAFQLFAKEIDTWERRYGDEMKESGKQIVRMNDGNYLINCSIKTADDDDIIWVIAINENGDSLWTKVIGDSMLNRYINDFSPGTAGEIFVASGYDQGGLGQTAFISKKTGTYDEIWTNTYTNLPSLGVWTNNVVATADSGCVVSGGYAESFDSGTGFIEMLDKEGNRIAYHVLESNLNDSILVIANLIEDMFVQQGPFDEECVVVGNIHTGETTYPYAQTYILDSLGVLIERIFDNLTFYFTGIEPVKSGYVIHGNSDLFKMDKGLRYYIWESELSPSIHSVKETTDDNLFVGTTSKTYKLNKDGQIIWEKDFGSNSLVLTDDGGCLAVGSKFGDVWICKFDQDGNYVNINNYATEIDGYELYQNYPNPFNPSTAISYALTSESQVTLSVFNTKGELVRSLVNEKKPAGNHSVNFNGEGLNSGIYFYRLNVDGKAVQSRKMMMLK